MKIPNRIAEEELTAIALFWMAKFAVQLSKAPSVSDSHSLAAHVDPRSRHALWWQCWQCDSSMSELCICTVSVRCAVIYELGMFDNTPSCYSLLADERACTSVRVKSPPQKMLPMTAHAHFTLSVICWSVSLSFFLHVCDVCVSTCPRRSSL